MKHITPLYLFFANIGAFLSFKLSGDTRQYFKIILAGTLFLIFIIVMMFFYIWDRFEIIKMGRYKDTAQSFFAEDAYPEPRLSLQ